ncbi:MAG TPA: hypothetical protein VI636_09555 [Candidatus Angelobacter sp.]
MDPSPPTLLFGHRAWRQCLQAACFVLLSAITVLAQTVRPVIDENIVQGPGKKAKGKIEYVNDSLQPLTVTLDTQSFTVSDTGELSYRPLDSNIHVKFSATSFRIPPRQSYLVFYEATADAVPSWFVVYATFAGYKERTAEGLKIQLLLPHTIYLLPKEQVKKDELVIKTAEYDPGSKIVRVRVENTGDVFCRVLEADLTAGQDKATNNGFPVFPHSQRQVEIPWPAKNGPTRLTLQLQQFQLQREIGSTMP